MKPLAIFQHDARQRPGCLLRCLEAAGIPWRVLHPADGEDVPRAARSFSGLVLLGSRCSVNEPRPWIERELRFVGDAVASEIPVLGQGYGGQLLARALGATVHHSAFPEVGWSRLRVTPAARALFGSSAEVLAFDWHDESFAIPQGATRTLFGTHCLNKGFVLGRHFAFQSHLDVDEEMVRDACARHVTEAIATQRFALGQGSDILHQLPERLAMVHETALRVYATWTGAIVRRSAAAAVGDRGAFR